MFFFSLTDVSEEFHHEAVPVAAVKEKRCSFFWHVAVSPRFSAVWTFPACRSWYLHIIPVSFHMVLISVAWTWRDVEARGLGVQPEGVFFLDTESSREHFNLQL